MAEKGDKTKDEMDEDPDFYIRTIAATWGHVDLIADWLPHHKHEPEVVTQNVLVPAAMYGQLQVLKMALNYGDVAMVDNSTSYPGWSLLHFAVEGFQRVLPTNTAGNDEEEQQSPAPTAQSPVTEQQICCTQLDIIYLLTKAGASPLLLDGQGHSASHMACHTLERKFLEGALLLDILSLDEVGGDRSRVNPPLETPGLASISVVDGWKNNMQVLMEWAFSRRHYEVLTFCHTHKYVSLHSDKLQMKSNPNSLRESQRPLAMAAIYEQDYQLIKLIMDLPDTKPNFLHRVYEYSHGQATAKESILSYVCQKHFEGYVGAVGRLFALDAGNKFLAAISLSGMGLRHLPLEIMHPNLVSLNVRDNQLDHYPRRDPTDSKSLGWNCPNVESLNFSNNHLSCLHPDIFLRHPKLTHLSMCSNEIRDVPNCVWVATSLKSLELSNNMIRDFPCPSLVLRNPSMNLGMFKRTVPRRRRNNSLDGETCLPSLRKSSVNYTMRSHHDTPKFMLETLDLSGNHLMNVPGGLACLAPFLKILRLSRNRITSIGSVSDYPAHLQTLDLSQNGLTRGVEPPPLNIANMLTCYQSQLDPDRRDACNHTDHSNFPALKYLDLIQNRIEDFPVEYENDNERKDLTDTLAEFELVKRPNPKAPAVLFFPNLHTLRISKNSLTQFPTNIHKLSHLRELVVCQNPKITRIPPLLHKLGSLFLFKFDGISDPIVPELEKLKTSTQVLYHLKARDVKCVTNNSMRLFVIGHHGKGKTTLLRSLKTVTAASNGLLASIMRSSSDAHANVPAEPEVAQGIECALWKCSSLVARSSSFSRSKQQQASVINFYTWDFAGQEEYYMAHQCFLTNRALYLLVWNVMDGEEGIENLNVWLQNLHARAEGHSHTVIVVATHLDLVIKQDRERIMNSCRERLQKVLSRGRNMRGYPSVASLQFVGCPSKAKNLNVDVLNDVIHKTACGMDSIRDLSERPLRVKMLEEMIPESYEYLRRYIESHKAKVPVVQKDSFRELVKDIISEEEELEAAIQFLYVTTGVVLHFDTPVLKDYYIVKPKVWFDLCCLIIAPTNVNQLIRTGRPGDEKFGLLSTAMMTSEFVRRDFSDDMCKLVRTFLSQFNIIHPVNREYYLIPSAISSEPILQLDEMAGEFPRRSDYLLDSPSMSTLDRLPSIDPLACSIRPSNMTSVHLTGLVYRRMLFLPPIPSGFWSNVIALFLQKPDIQQIITHAYPGENAPTLAGPAHRLVAVIGNLEMRWTYWKTGIVLYLGETVVMELHSLIGDEFERQSPDSVGAFEVRRKKLDQFRYRVGDGWRSVPSLFNNVVEIIIPQFFLVNGIPRVTPIPSDAPPVSNHILVKALEILDEVLKSLSEPFAHSGIYTQKEMLHVVPCPLEYGDKDCRPINEPSEAVYGLKSFLLSSQEPGYIAGGADDDDDDVLYAQQSFREGGGNSETPKEPEPPEDCICVFTIDYLIRTTLVADEVTCSKCGELDLVALAPDLVFADIAQFKLDKAALDKPVDQGGTDAVASGAFGTVFKRDLYHDQGRLLVAVKVFDQSDVGILSLGRQEITRSYSDMRYELNKLCTLSHAYIVRFVGVFTNPHCFVLEWAPLHSLEHQRVRQSEARVGMCYFSIMKILYQVSGALKYLHFDVGIVHRDLKPSNILVFKFPPVGHFCFQDGRQQECEVLVKITDMGICANPLGRKASSLAGLRLMAPECIAGESNKLTEKVDIFTLGSCLYEMMTLHHLPPGNMSQPEYKNMLVMGKRPQITHKDFIYPPVVSHVLEECWQQDHFKRPSARSICDTVSALLSGEKHRQPRADNLDVDANIVPLFLDSFVLHPVNRVTACHCSNLEGAGFEASLALSDQGLGGILQSSTIVAGAAYNKDCEKSELEIDPFDNLRNTAVVSVHLTTNSDIVVGCLNGTVTLYDVKGNKTPMNTECSRAAEHGELVKAYYSTEAALMLAAYKNGAVHIRKCTQNLASSHAWRTSCLSLEGPSLSLCDVECMLLLDGGHLLENSLHRQQSSELQDDATMSGRSLEVWFGVDSDVIEVWSLSLDQVWTSDTLSQVRKVTNARVLNASGTSRGEEECEVCLVKGSTDLSMVAAVRQTPRGGRVHIGLFDALTKQLLRSLEFNISVSAILLTPSALALGTYDGKVHLYDTRSLLETTSDSTPHPQVLHAHKNRVYYLHAVPCAISRDGHTSLFPTYIGRCADAVQRQLIVSIGSGRFFPVESSKFFRKFEHQKGCFLNLWLV